VPESHPRGRREAGQALILAVVSLTALMGAAGLAIDMGYMRVERRQMQLAADSAALVGAAEINNGDSVAAAQNSAQLNGFPSTSVTVSPVTLPSGQNAIQVQIQQAVPTFFMNIFGVSTVSVAATGVAYLGNSTGCVYALQTGGSGINVTGTVTATKCGIIDNGDLNGGGTLDVSYVGYGGTNTAASTVVAQNIAATPAADPLFFLRAIPPPVGSPCTPAVTVVSPASAALGPGTYCGISINTTGTVTFSPGVYVITGGGNLTISAGNVSSTGGVTFYLNGTSQVQITGGTVSLSAPTSGTYASGTYPGILFFQDPADTAAATVSGAATLAGALYFPDAALSLTPTGPAAPYTIVVAQTISSLGDPALGITLGSDYSSLANGSPITAALLVE
jgi:hypothetical protein